MEGIRVLHHFKIEGEMARIRLIIYFLILMISDSKSLYDQMYLNSAIEYLQEYNGVNVKDLGFLVGPKFDNGDKSTMLEDLNEDLLEDIQDRNSEQKENSRFLSTFRA